MKIGILEICERNHSIAVKTIANIFKGHEVFAFVKNDVAKNIQDLTQDGVNIFVYESCEGDFFQMINDLELDILFITTLSTKFKEFYRFKPNFKTKVFVNLRSSEKWVRKFPENFFLREIVWHYLRQIWNKRMDGATVGIQNQKDFLIKKGFKKSICVIPFSLYEPHEDLSRENKILKVVIPGFVSEIRRENLKFLNAFEKLPEIFKDKISINFLGAPGKEKGNCYNEILIKILELRNKRFKIILHDNFIYLDEYNKQLDEADLIFAPINIKCGKEIYNESKDTGISHTMISHAKPGLFPKEMKPIEELKSSTLLFNNYSDVINIFKDLINNKSFVKYLKEMAKENSLKFTLEKVREKVLGFVTQEFKMENKL